MIGESPHIQRPIWSFPQGELRFSKAITTSYFNRVELLYFIDLFFNNLNKHGHFPCTNQMALP
jgi:hypothetical protein